MSQRLTFMYAILKPELPGFRNTTWVVFRPDGEITITTNRSMIDMGLSMANREGIILKLIDTEVAKVMLKQAIGG